MGVAEFDMGAFLYPGKGPPPPPPPPPPPTGKVSTVVVELMVAISI